MTPEDQKHILAWAESRGIPFMEDDIPFLAQEIAKLNITVARWCELQDKQQQLLAEKFSNKG
jgi:hypothetical protein